MFIIQAEESYQSKEHESVVIDKCYFTYYHLEVALEYLLKYKGFMVIKYGGINYSFQVKGVSEVSIDCDKNLMETLGIICLDEKFETSLH